MTTCLLNINQSPEELDKIYRDDYYWYLREPIFCEAVCRPAGDAVNALGFPCLDVGCGEGQLSQYIKVPYTGFDGSRQSIRNAKEAYPCQEFHVGRLENPPLLPSHRFGTIIFSNLLEVLIKPEWYLRFIQMYLDRYESTNFVVVDLLRLDTVNLESVFHLMSSKQVTAKIPNLMDVKKHRKVLTFSCTG